MATRNNFGGQGPSFIKTRVPQPLVHAHFRKTLGQGSILAFQPHQCRSKGVVWVNLVLFLGTGLERFRFVIAIIAARLAFGLAFAAGRFATVTIASARFAARILRPCRRTTAPSKGIKYLGLGGCRVSCWRICGI